MKSNHDVLPDATIDQFTQTASKLSWDILTTVPPMISAEPCADTYHSEWHEKEGEPTWNKNLSRYELVYHRPILFWSCEGTVARKGWVGNKMVLSSSTGREEHSADDVLVSEVERNGLSVCKPKESRDLHGVEHNSCGESCHHHRKSDDHHVESCDCHVTMKHATKPRTVSRKLGSYSNKSHPVADNSSGLRGPDHSRVLSSQRQVLGVQSDMSRDQQWRSNYVQKMAVRPNRDKDSLSPQNDSADIWTGESMWRFRS